MSDPNQTQPEQPASAENAPVYEDPKSDAREIANQTINAAGVYAAEQQAERPKPGMIGAGAGASPTPPRQPGDFVIVRGERSGIFFGQLGYSRGRECDLIGARRITFRHQVPGETVTNPILVTEPVTRVAIKDVCEIITCSRDDAEYLLIGRPITPGRAFAYGVGCY